MNTSTSPSLPDFARLATAFCTWCESDAVGNAPELAISRWFSQLYAGGLLLSEVQAESNAPDDVPSNVEAGEAAIGTLRGYYYREVFDPNPTLAEEPCVGDIGDDLLDVYKDIKRGLALFDAGFPRAAEWEWAFHFRIHWGRHAVAGLLALHCMVHSNLATEHAP